MDALSLGAFAAAAHPTLRQASATSAIPTGIMRVRKGDFVSMRFAMRDAFLEARGVDSSKQDGVAAPKTTNEDARAIARYWSEALQRFGKGVGGAWPRDWRTYAKRVQSQTAGRPKAQTYSENYQLWREVTKLAIHLNSIRGARPSEWSYAWEALKESAAELPENLASAGQAIGRVAVSPIAGAAKGLGLDTKTVLTGVVIATISAVVISKVLP